MTIEEAEKILRRIGRADEYYGVLDIEVSLTAGLTLSQIIEAAKVVGVEEERVRAREISEPENTAEYGTCSRTFTDARIT